jgi:hypothetical protein
MTLKKLLKLLSIINSAYASVKDVNMHGSQLWANGSGELVLSFNTQPPQSFDRYLRAAGFVVWQGDYIYRPKIRTRAPTLAMIRSATVRTQ